jgi:NMD protein affecting ribosome stability and mRNA decay
MGKQRCKKTENSKQMICVDCGIQMAPSYITQCEHCLSKVKE